MPIISCCYWHGWIVKAFQKRNTKKTHEGILLARSAIIHLSTYLPVHFLTLKKKTKNLLALFLWIWEQDTIKARQIVLAILSAPMSCFLIQEYDPCFNISGSGNPAKRRGVWLSLAFGHISEWSIQSDRDKLAVIIEEPTTQKTTHSNCGSGTICHFRQATVGGL